MTAGEKLAAAARMWLGTPYVHNAKIRGVGVDCARLVIGAAEDAGLIARDSLDPGDYSNEWHLHRQEDIMRKIAEEYCDEVTEMACGDILLYQYGRVCSHAGIYVGGDEVIHSYVGAGAILSRTNDIIFYTRAGKHRLRHIYRFRGSM